MLDMINILRSYSISELMCHSMKKLGLGPIVPCISKSSSTESTRFRNCFHVRLVGPRKRHSNANKDESY